VLYKSALWASVGTVVTALFALGPIIYAASSSDGGGVDACTLSAEQTAIIKGFELSASCGAYNMTIDSVRALN